jgi:hypothetical protein
MALETMANVHLTRGGMSLPARAWKRVNLWSSLSTLRLTVTEVAILWLAHKIFRLLCDQVLCTAPCDRFIILTKIDFSTKCDLLLPHSAYSIFEFP